MAERSDEEPAPREQQDPLPSTADLTTQLEQARNELAELERAVETLPDIFETKFCAAVKTVMDTNRALAHEQRQLNEALRTALPPASPLRLPAVKLKLSPLDWHRDRRASLVVGVSLTLGLAIAGVLAQRPRLPWQQNQASRPNPKPVQAAALRTDSVLQLRATGSSWVEVQDLQTGEVLLIGVLEAGDARTIRLRQGLRMRSGRPDLLNLQIDDGPPRAFGDINGLGWQTVLPPHVRKAPA